MKKVNKKFQKQLHASGEKRNKSLILPDNTSAPVCCLPDNHITNTTKCKAPNEKYMI